MRSLSIGWALTLATGMPASVDVSAPREPTTPVVRDQQDGVVQMARGTVQSVDVADRDFVIATERPGSATKLTWDENTVFMREGKVTERENVLKERVLVVVAHKKGLASKVEAIDTDR